VLRYLLPNNSQNFRCHFYCFSTPQPVDAVFPNSYGQPEDCEQDECDFYVKWRNNDRFVDFRMEGNATGWIALGLSGINDPLNMVSTVTTHS